MSQLYHKPPSNTTTIPDFAVSLAAARAAAELELIASIVCDRYRGVPVAQFADIDGRSFNQPDYSLLYVAAEFAAEQGVDFMVAAEFLLKHFHLWDATEPAANIGLSMRWSMPMLAALTSRCFHCPPEIERRVEILHVIIKKQARIQHLLNELAEVAA